MHQHFDSGFTLRFPGHKKDVIPRVGLSAIGPFHEVSADGHEKLSQSALQMGEIGLPIYAYKDKWSDYLLMLRLLPNSRTAAAIGHLFLDLVEEIGCESTVLSLAHSNQLYRHPSSNDDRQRVRNRLAIRIPVYFAVR